MAVAFVVRSTQSFFAANAFISPKPVAWTARVEGTARVHVKVGTDVTQANQATSDDFPVARDVDALFAVGANEGVAVLVDGGQQTIWVSDVVVSDPAALAAANPGATSEDVAAAAAAVVAAVQNAAVAEVAAITAAAATIVAAELAHGNH